MKLCQRSESYQWMRDSSMLFRLRHTLAQFVLCVRNCTQQIDMKAEAHSTDDARDCVWHSQLIEIQSSSSSPHRPRLTRKSFLSNSSKLTSLEGHWYCWNFPYGLERAVSHTRIFILCDIGNLTVDSELSRATAVVKCNKKINNKTLIAGSNERRCAAARKKMGQFRSDYTRWMRGVNEFSRSFKLNSMNLAKFVYGKSERQFSQLDVMMSM